MKLSDTEVCTKVLNLLSTKYSNLISTRFSQSIIKLLIRQILVFLQIFCLHCRIPLNNTSRKRDSLFWEKIIWIHYFSSSFNNSKRFNKNQDQATLHVYSHATPDLDKTIILSYQQHNIINGRSLCFALSVPFNSVWSKIDSVVYVIHAVSYNAGDTNSKRDQPRASIEINVLYLPGV